MGSWFSLRRRDRNSSGKDRVKQSTLSALIEAGNSSKGIVLLRELGGPQFLFDYDGAFALNDGKRVCVNDILSDEILELCERALVHDQTNAVIVEGKRYLVQPFLSAHRLIIIGAVHIAQKLAPMAKLAGYQVFLLDPRSAFASTERFPDLEIINEWPHEVMPSLELDVRTALVALSHDAKIDEPALIAALKSDAFYIGALGSKKNHKKRLARLANSGFSESTLSRIYGPIGIPLGGRSPAEIAIAIIAQITQARYASKET